MLRMTSACDRRVCRIAFAFLALLGVGGWMLIGAASSVRASAPISLQCNLTALEQAVTAGGSYVFSCNGASSDIQMSEALDVARPLSLDGGSSGVTLDGGGQRQIFHVRPGVALTIEHMTLINAGWPSIPSMSGLPGSEGENGELGDYGANGGLGGPGGPGQAGAAPFVYPLLQGGAIHNEGTLTLIADRLTGNHTSGPSGGEGGNGGAGGYGNCGGAGVSEGEAGTGPGGNGGAGGRGGDPGSGGPGGPGQGGAVYNAAGATLTVSETVFSGDDATGGAGGNAGAGGAGGKGGCGGFGGAAGGGSGADGADGANGGAGGPGSDGEGGAIYNAGTLTIENGTQFSSDSATGGDGGSGGSGGNGGNGEDNGILAAHGTPGRTGDGGHAGDGGEGAGAGAGAGGAIYNAGTLTVQSGVVFASNTATGGDAGAGGAGGNGGNGGNASSSEDELGIPGNAAHGGSGGDAGGAGSAQGGAIFSESKFKLGAATFTGQTLSPGRTAAAADTGEDGKPGGTYNDAAELIGEGAVSVGFTPHPGTTGASGIAEGQDVQAPGTEPWPSAAELKAMLLRQLKPAGKAAKIKRLLKAGGYVGSFDAPSAGTAQLDWYQLPPGAHLSARRPKPVLIAAGRVTLHSAGSARLKLALTAAGKRLLKHSRRVTLTAKATFTPPGEAAILAEERFTLTA